MAELGEFNAEEHKPLDSFDPIPPDKYVAMIVESDIADTKSAGGKRLAITWQIVDGEYEGRKVFDNVNLQNASTQAVEIGQRQLATICRAVGKLKVKDSAELHDIPCIIDVRIKPAKGDYAAGNEIRGYAPINPEAATIATTPAPRAPSAFRSTMGAAPAGATATAQTRTPTANGKPPWAQRR